MEDDEIIGLRKRCDKKSKEFFGYSLITTKYPENNGIHPFVHRVLLDAEKVNGYTRLLKDYLKKHPELLVIFITIFFPALLSSFALNPILKPLLVRRIGL